MKTFNYIVKDLMGLHAHPATLIFNEANKFVSSIKIHYDENEINCKSVISIMTACVPKNAEITISINGIDEDDAYNAIYNIFFNNNL